VAEAVTGIEAGTVAEAVTGIEAVTVAEAVTMAWAKNVASLLTVTTLAMVVGTAVDHAEGSATTATSAKVEEFEPSAKTIGADIAGSTNLSGKTESRPSG
jgi:hypothetical protein